MEKRHITSGEIKHLFVLADMNKDNMISSTVIYKYYYIRNGMILELTLSNYMKAPEELKITELIKLLLILCYKKKFSKESVLKKKVEFSIYVNRT